MNDLEKRVCLILLLVWVSGVARSQSFPNSDLYQEFIGKLESNPDADGLRGNLRGLVKTVESSTLGLSPFQVDESKALVWAAYSGGIKILLFSPRAQSWPGHQPITLVLTDQELNLVDWMEMGGQPVFHRAELNETTGRIKIIYRSRGGGAFVQIVQLKANTMKVIESGSVVGLNLGIYLHERFSGESGTTGFE